MIKVTERIELEKATSVEVYLESAGYQMKRIAVELNGEILPKRVCGQDVRRRRLHGGGDICRRRLKMETTKVLTKEEIQAALEERHSPEKQKKLSEGRVTIAGLGGLGSNVAYALARIGVGHLHLIDFDVWILRI